MCNRGSRAGKTGFAFSQPAFQALNLDRDSVSKWPSHFLVIVIQKLNCLLGPLDKESSFLNHDPLEGKQP